MHAISMLFYMPISLRRLLYVYALSDGDILNTPIKPRNTNSEQIADNDEYRPYLLLA
jgi:hypothetical protein